MEECGVHTRDDATMIAASMMYSGTAGFPYEVEFRDGLVETEAARISNINIKREESMSDISLQIAIKEENAYLFKRCIRKLLESTFILRDKDEKLYQFVSRESNRQDISEYLRMIGFDVIVEEKTGVCMLVASEEDADTVGLKRANVVTFSTLQYHLLLVLWKVYLENLGYSEGIL